MTGEFSAQLASNAENVSIWWRYHVKWVRVVLFCIFGWNAVHIMSPKGLMTCSSYDCSKVDAMLKILQRTSRDRHGPLTRYAKLRAAHAPGMPGTVSPPLRVSDPEMHHGTCVTHVPWCMPGSLTSGFLWSWWRGKRSRNSRRMRSPLFCVSGKRPKATVKLITKKKPQQWYFYNNFIKRLLKRYHSSYCRDSLWHILPRNWILI